MKSSTAHHEDILLKDSDFNYIKSVIYDVAGITIADHKKQMVSNRISRRMKQLSLDTIEDYMLRIQNQLDDEMMDLVNALTTNVTHFFREDHHFKHLETHIPDLIEKGQKRIRLWSAACSIGAEPYSAAISICDSAPDYRGQTDLKILATDIDTIALDRARQGIYQQRFVKGVNDMRMKKYFKVTNDKSYQIHPELRQMITFNYMNFNDDPWPMSGPFDFIFCRNVLIYFDRPKQDEYIGKMINLLAPGGFLYLGHSENAVMSGKPHMRSCGPTIYQKDQVHS